MNTNYYTVAGTLVGEETAGNRIEYMVDALGSVSGTIANSAVENTYCYTPYGELIQKTGTAPDPSFRWAGAHGYRDIGRLASTHYVRARHYAGPIGRWTTVDPLWPGEQAYTYALDRPPSLVDPSGLTCDVYRLLYTGSCDAPDEVYQAALDEGLRAAECYYDCTKLAFFYIYVAVGPIPKPPNLRMPGTKPWTNTASVVSYAMRKYLNIKLRHFFSRPYKKCVKIPWCRAATIAIVSVAVATTCAAFCSRDEAYEDLEDVES